jgi:hypothetical protein
VWHGTVVYFARMGPIGPALERFPDIKKKKKKDVIYQHKLMINSVCVT